MTGHDESESTVTIRRNARSRSTGIPTKKPGRSGASAVGRQQKVLLLGRYLRDSHYFPPHHDIGNLAVEFITAHASKGLEGDHVIIPRMTSETLGFPCKVTEDPVLCLAMPEGDPMEYAEERRLFYVGLTRARKSVTLITIQNKESPFISELVKDHGVSVLDSYGNVRSRTICPSCGLGFLVHRDGKYGPFMGCSRFPTCKYTRNATMNAATKPVANIYR